MSYVIIEPPWIKLKRMLFGNNHPDVKAFDEEKARLFNASHGVFTKPGKKEPKTDSK